MVCFAGVTFDFGTSSLIFALLGVRTPHVPSNVRVTGNVVTFVFCCSEYHLCKNLCYVCIKNYPICRKCTKMPYSITGQLEKRDC